MTRPPCRSAPIAVALLAGLAACAAQAQPAFPRQPMRMLVPFSPGSLTDILARTVAQKMTETWGQQVVIDNRPSGGGIVASQTLIQSNPDGHTLMMVSAGHAISATLFPKLPYDVVRDFAPVSQVVAGTHVLAASPALGVKTVKELIALARAKPLTYGTAIVGSGAHVNGELFRMDAGIDVQHISYKGPLEAMNDVVAGRVAFTWLSLGVAVPFIKDGRVVAIGVSSAQRSPLMPGIPTIAESGLPGHQFDNWFGLLAPAKTPRPIVSQISREVARIVELPDVRERLIGLGAVPKASTPDEFAKFIAAEVVRLGKVVKAAGIRSE